MQTRSPSLTERSFRGSAALPTAAVLALAFFLAACVPSPAHFLKFDNTFSNAGPGKRPWRTVAVLPFGGDPSLRRPAAEWFAHRLRPLGIVDVVDPAPAEWALRAKGTSPRPEGGFSDNEAHRVGIALGVDGVLFGAVSIPGPRSAAFEQPAVSASLLDMATGRVVSETRWPTVPSDPGPFETRLAAAVDHAFADLLPALYAGAAKPLPPPRTAPASPPADAGDTVR
ncbi:MAG TPA: hypothetical protein VGK27_00820 [Candidatus Deferrimicrobiaceae bacterium]|jgi:hypothetical protein